MKSQRTLFLWYTEEYCALYRKKVILKSCLNLNLWYYVTLICLYSDGEHALKNKNNKPRKCMYTVVCISWVCICICIKDTSSRFVLCVVFWLFFWLFCFYCYFQTQSLVFILHVFILHVLFLQTTCIAFSGDSQLLPKRSIILSQACCEKASAYYF